MLTTEDIRWDKTVDVAVIGYGLAGAVATITAHDMGVQVLVLEKQPLDSHCSSSSLSSGRFLNSIDINGTFNYFQSLYQVDQDLAWTDRDSMRVLAEYCGQNTVWLANLGGKSKFLCKTSDHPRLPGADSIELWEFHGKGFHLMKFMYQQVEKRQIEVLYQTPAERLYTDQSGRVIGVRATGKINGKDRLINIKVSKGVILGTGGFEANEEMKLQFLNVYPVYFTGGAANTGDGIKMAQEVGADLWHMTCVSARLVAKFREFPIAFSLNFGGKIWSKNRLLGTKKKLTAGFIIVDKNGRRYTNEDIKGHSLFYELTNFDSHQLEYPKAPSYFIFDRNRMDSGPLALASGIAGPHRIYKWSTDNMAELNKGWIVRGDSVSELAEKIGMAASVLVETLRKWNAFCAAGNDAEFGRPIHELVPLNAPPYYAVKLFPGGPNTQGGPKRNCRGQVLTPFGNPIPGLYAAGECGSVFGMLYPVTGGNLAECIAFGRIAAENAMAERPV